MRSLFLAVLVLTGIAVFAQNNDKRNINPDEKTRKFIKLWTRELTLTPEQQTKAQAPVLDMFTKIGKLKADTTMDRKLRGKAIMAERKAGTDAFKAILTPEQSALYDKRVQEMKDKQRNKQGGGGKGTGKGTGKGNGKNKGVKQAAEEELENDDLF